MPQYRSNGGNRVRMPDLQTRSERITLRLTPELRAQLDRLARENRRTLSEYLYLLLEDHVNEVASPKKRS